MAEISIIIRAKNEEKWIGRCIRMIRKQKIKKEYEIVLVDSGSSDKTIEIASCNQCKIVNISNYKPGYAINKGIEATDSSVIVVLSAHCIPANEEWLTRITEDLFDKSKQINAVYGRQLPTPSSNANDIRDLAITFGVEDKIQRKDPFFHNANSAFKRSLWKEINFDNDVTNIEDRLWAEKILQEGNQILYKSNASVFHWHGIHQYGNNKRAEHTARILTKTANLHDNEYCYPKENEQLTAIVTFRCDEKEESYQSSLLSKLLKCLGDTKQKWNVIINSKRLVLSEYNVIPNNVKYVWLGKSDEDEKMEYANILRKNIQEFERISGSITEYCAAFNLGYLWRDANDINQMTEKFCKYDYDILMPTLIYDKDNKYSTKEEDESCITETILTNTEKLIVNARRMAENEGGLSLPGYCLMFRSSILRILGEEKYFQVGRIRITGQEKLLKVDNNAAYQELIAKINLNLIQK